MKSRNIIVLTTTDKMSELVGWCRNNKIRKDIESITIKHYMTEMAPNLASVTTHGPKAVMHYFDY